MTHSNHDQYLKQYPSQYLHYRDIVLWLKYFLYISCYLLPLSITIQAKTFTGFISDNLTTILYEKADSDSAIIDYLEAGQEIRIESVNNEGWNKIRLEDGTLGWVESRFISTTPGRLQQIFVLKEKILSLQKQLAIKKKEVSFSQQEIEKYRRYNVDLRKQVFNQQSKLTRYEKIMADPLKVVKENRQLKRNLEFLKIDHSVLHRSIHNINERNQSEWQTLLIICIIAFLLLGFIIGKRVTERKKISWKNI